MEAIKSKIASLLKCGIRAYGRDALEKFAAGRKITRAGAIKAKCYDCMGGYADGIADCQDHDCPLYPFHPYKGRM